MPTWDAQLYLRFANERTQPSLDLVARIKVENPQHIIDIGCGPGNSTAVLRQRWPDAEVVGLDNSPEMIAAAAVSYPDQAWVLADAASWVADRHFDLVFSNAALQWLPDHERLFPHLFEQVGDGGALAVQMPAHYHGSFHQVMLEVANDPAWSHLMDPARNALTKQPPAFYYDVLQPVASHIDLWETEYNHIMESPQAIIDWFRGTGMRPFLEVLPTKAEQQRFEQLVLKGCTERYLRQKDGKVLFPFRRLFLVAYR
jgi:trans-aconitate 2-methyltransferase